MKEVCSMGIPGDISATSEGCDREFTLRPELQKKVNIVYTQVCGNCIHYEVRGWPHGKTRDEEDTEG